MNLILTMAGKYTRFINEGYRIPKYLLPWGEKSILSEILIQMNKNNDFKNIYLITNKQDDIYMPHVRKILESLNIPKENLYQIFDTSGQAETAFTAIDKIKEKLDDAPIIFHNIDTILYKRNYTQIPTILASKDGFIDVFKSNNHNYSYVLMEDNKVVSIAEKIVISNNATSGLYGFKNYQTFLNYYDKETLYISEVYQKMIDDGKQIVISELHDESDTIVLGTPSEYLTSSYIIDL